MYNFTLKMREPLLLFLNVKINRLKYIGADTILNTCVGESKRILISSCRNYNHGAFVLSSGALGFKTLGKIYKFENICPKTYPIESLNLLKESEYNTSIQINDIQYFIQSQRNLAFSISSSMHNCKPSKSFDKLGWLRRGKKVFKVGYKVFSCLLGVTLIYWWLSNLIVSMLLDFLQIIGD